MNAPEISASMFQAAAADTTVLAWYQFDSPAGTPDPQGWTARDVTAPSGTHFHVDGPACHGMPAINGAKSLWCGQWASNADAWCSWVALPGYGNNWDQRLEATVSASTVSYTIEWDSEPGYDFTRLEWFDSTSGQWVEDPNGYYDGVGGPLSEVRASPYGPTSVRFRFTSDGAYSDEDGLFSTVEGAVKIDDISIDGGPVEDFEGAACEDNIIGNWSASSIPGFGL